MPNDQKRIDEVARVKKLSESDFFIELNEKLDVFNDTRAEDGMANIRQLIADRQAVEGAKPTMAEGSSGAPKPSVPAATP